MIVKCKGYELVCKGYKLVWAVGFSHHANIGWVCSCAVDTAGIAAYCCMLDKA